MVIGFIVICALGLIGIITAPPKSGTRQPSGSSFAASQEQPAFENDEAEIAIFETDEEREERQARAQEHVANAYSYWAGNQLGLALAEAEQAVAADSSNGEAQTLRQQIDDARLADLRAVREAEEAVASAARAAEATATMANRQQAATAARNARRDNSALLDVRRLVADPKEYVGQDIVLQGRALTVTQHGDYTWVQLMAAVPGRTGTTESVVVEFRPKITEILRDECYRMWGKVKGTQRVTRTLTGARNEVPVLDGFLYGPSGRTSSGISCAAP